MTTASHGSRARYQNGCRCTPCVEANATYHRNWVAGRRDTYVDPIAVERACAGDRTVNLRSAEVAAAVAHLTAHGHNFLQTARLLGLSDRTVFRIVHGHTAVPYSRPGRGAA